MANQKDIAHLSIYLLSNQSNWMTGSLINIDGGFSLKVISDKFLNEL